MSTMTDQLHKIAAEAYACFETATRDNGSEFVRVKEGSPEWVTDLVRKAHGDDFLPDDWRYETIRSALGFIADEATDKSAPTSDRDPDDASAEFADSQVDVYTSELIAWMGSNLRRVGYVDEAVEEYGGELAGDIVRQIMLGQYAEAEEVYALTLNALEDLTD